MIKLPLYSFKTNYKDHRFKQLNHRRKRHDSICHETVASIIGGDRQNSVTGSNKTRYHSNDPSSRDINTRMYEDLEFLQRTKALVDTGCSMTSISYAFFKEINKENRLRLEDPPLHITTTTCDGSENEIAGITRVALAFNARDEQNVLGVSMNILVIPKLQGSMILGLRFFSLKICL